MTQLSEAFVRFADWRNTQNPPAAECDGLDVTTLGEWEFRFNRHEREVESVPAMALAVYRLGWPVGVIGPTGGTLAAGLEDQLIADLREATGEGLNDDQ